MRIIQVITELRPAGAEKIVAELSKYLQDKKHEVSVIALKSLPKEDMIVRELKEAGISVYSLDVSKRHPFRIFRLRKLLKNLSPDIVHAHLIHANITSRLNRDSRKYALVNTVHVAEKRKRKFWHFILDRLTLFICDCETAVSEAVRDFHSARIKLAPEKMPVIYNGIHFPQKPDEEKIKALRKEWGVSDCTKLIGSTGRLDWQKGYDKLMKLLPDIASVVPEHEKWGLVLLGEGPARAKLEKMASASPQNLKIVMPGFREDAAEACGAFDLFVMPSRYEGFGLTMIEAMVQGLPIIYSDVDSLPELATRYPLAESLDFEISCGHIMAERAAALIKKKKINFSPPFTLEKMCVSYIDLYKKLLNDRSCSNARK